MAKPHASSTTASKQPITSIPSEVQTPKKYINSVGMQFALIPSGSFMMGSLLRPDEVDRKFEGIGGLVLAIEDEYPVHNVKITRPFYIQTTEVTVGQWRRFVSETGYKTFAEGKGGGTFVAGGMTLIRTARSGPTVRDVAVNGIELKPHPLVLSLLTHSDFTT